MLLSGGLECVVHICGIHVAHVVLAYVTCSNISSRRLLFEPGPVFVFFLFFVFVFFVVFLFFFCFLFVFFFFQAEDGIRDKAT